MLTSAHVLSFFVVPLVVSLIWPTKQENGYPDLSSIINHMALLDQQIEALQTALQNQIQTSNLNLNTMATKLKSANDKISDLEKKISALSHDQGRVSAALNSSISSGLEECKTEIETLRTTSQSNTTNLQDLIMDNQNLIMDNQEMIMDNQEMIKNATEETPVAFQTVQDPDGTTVQNKQNLKFDSVVNLGGAYSKHTGVFTVPRSGVYMFWANIDSNNDGNFEIQLVKNGKHLVGGFTGYQLSMGTASFVYVSDFKQGDNIAFLNIQVGGITVVNGYGFSGYGGVLIGK